MTVSAANACVSLQASASLWCPHFHVVSRFLARAGLSRLRCLTARLACCSPVEPSRTTQPPCRLLPACIASHTRTCDQPSQQGALQTYSNENHPESTLHHCSIPSKLLMNFCSFAGPSGCCPMACWLCLQGSVGNCSIEAAA